MKTWWAARLLGIWGIAGALPMAVGCNELLGNLPPGSGFGGELGSGGGSSGGDGNQPGQTGGTSGGNASGGAATGGSGQTGTGGQPLTALDGPCVGSGSVACDVGNATQKLICSQGIWESNGSCDFGENCDPATGRCAPILAECADLDAGETYCTENDEVSACGPNLVSSVVLEECEGKCVVPISSAVCAPATCGDGKVQSGEDCDDGNTDNTDLCTEACTSLVVQVVAGGNDSCALRVDGQVKCWGGNDSGQLGLGHTNSRGDAAGELGENAPALDLGTGRTVTAIAAGGHHNCALLDDESVKCWGYSGNGELGIGDTSARGDAPGEMGDALPAVDLGSGRSAKALACGSSHTCALLDDSTIKCWGRNDYGQLGIGSTTNRGAAPGEMGESLPAVDLGSGRTATAVACGLVHTCALLDDSTVKCWGGSAIGQLGQGDTVSRGRAPGEMGDSLFAVDLGPGRTARSLASTESHTCVILDDWSVKCWGANNFGQLGLGSADHRGDEPDEMGQSLPAVDLGPGRTARAIAAGSYHTCALLDDSSLKCWGESNFGQLGLGDTTARGDGLGEMGQSLPTVELGTGRTIAVVSSASYHSCALLDDSTVKCWGHNTDGQLGIGEVTPRGDGPDEMGDSLPAVSLW